MARNPSSKPDSGSAQSSATIGVDLSAAKDNMIALPGQLFYSTQIPVRLWFLAKNKNADAKRGPRDRRKQTLFMDARKLGTLIACVHRELTDEDLSKITSTYHSRRGDAVVEIFNDQRKNVSDSGYADVARFCKSATTVEIAAHGHVLTPGRYVGAEEVEDDGDPFEEKILRLVAELNSLFAESVKLGQAITANLPARRGVRRKVGRWPGYAPTLTDSLRFSKFPLYRFQFESKILLQLNNETRSN